MGRGLGDFFAALQLLLPTWALVLLGVGVVALIVPRWRYRVRDKQVRESIRRWVRAPLSERPHWSQRALDRAGEDVDLLSVLVREARKRAMPDLIEEGLRRLDQAGPRGVAEARRLRADTARKALDPMHPLEVEVRVRALLDEGIVEAARARLDEGLSAHPSDPTLLALQTEVRAAVQAAGGPVDEAGDQR